MSTLAVLSSLGGVVSAFWGIAVFNKYSRREYKNSIQTEIVNIKVSAEADEVILVVKYLSGGVYKEYAYKKKALGNTDDARMEYISNFMRRHPLKTQFKMLIKKDKEGQVSMIPFIPLNKSVRNWTLILGAYIGLIVFLTMRA